MCLRFLFLLITRLAAWLRLSRREETWKTAEILILRHLLAVLQRRQPCRPKLGVGGPGPARTGAARRDTESPPRHGLGCWSPRTRSCTGTETSSGAAGRRGPCAAGPADRPPAGTSGPWSSEWPGEPRVTPRRRRTPRRPATGQRRDHHAHRAARNREPLPGLPADPRGDAQPQPPNQRVHHPPDPAAARSHPRPKALIG